MSVKKIGPLPTIADVKPYTQGWRLSRCLHPLHDPPRHTYLLEPGEYENTCPQCGKVTVFYVGARHVYY